MYISVDFETTGLDPDESKIVEIGAVKFNENGQIIDTFEILVNPSIKISKSAGNVHGITEEMLIGKPTPRDGWEMCLEWAGGDNTFFAHNAQFEVSFIKALYNQTDTVPDIAFVDTLAAARKRLKGRSSYKLTELVKEIDGDAHRALPDAKACVTLFIMLAETYKSGKLPIATHSKMLSEYTRHNEPTNKQMSYIISLGGDPDRVDTKKEASVYIDLLIKESPEPSAGLKEDTIKIQQKIMKYVYLTLNWFFGVFFLLGGLTTLPKSILSGACLITISLLLLPSSREFVYSKTNKRLSFKARAAMIFVIFFAFSVLNAQSQSENNQEEMAQNTNVTIEQGHNLKK
ncbi:MAG: DNA polymerase III epsilon subunit family exonuclease [Oleispira sp.]|jgi:DNA polymerase III epsilon subunit family exonuclease